MASALKKKQKGTEEEFVLMHRTRALLAEAWELWRESFEQSPAIAKRVMMQGVKELHRAEKEIQDKAKGKVVKLATKAGAKSSKSNARKTAKAKPAHKAKAKRKAKA